MCPKMLQEFEKISLSCWMIARRINELAGDICDTLKDKVKNFVLWNFAINKSSDVKNAAQLAIFIKGVEQNRRTSVTTVYEGYYNWCCNVQAHKRLYKHVETLVYTHTECECLSLSSFKRNGNVPREEDRICRSIEKLFNEFSACFKDFKSYEHLFEIFSSSFHTDIDKAPTDIQMELIDLQKRTDLKAKYVKINLGDFYQKYLDQDKFLNLRKFMASKMAFFGSTYLCEHFFSKIGFMKSY